jgi:YidC/Oxa1 family membrane protein insertase
MDRNTMIGLGLIGVILATFTYMYQPSEEEVKKAKLEKEKTEKPAKEKESKKSVEKKTEDVEEAKTLVLDGFEPKLDENKKQIIAETGELVYVNKTTQKDTLIAASNEKSTFEEVEKGELIRLETDKHIFDFSTKGGVLAAVYLKEFTSYRNYSKKLDKKIPLKLFAEGDNVNELSFPLDGKDFRTGNKLFTVKEQSKNSIVFELIPAENQSIEFIYSLKKDAYDIDFDVKLKGFAGKTSPQNVMLAWNTDFYKTERLLSEQKRVSTICYKPKGENFDWLSEIADDEEEVETAVEWVAFKQSYFSSFMNPKNGFAKDGTKLKVTNFQEGDDKYHTHIKKYEANLNLAVSNVGDATASINWYFGPNDYETLRSYKTGYEDIINYGWGLFRWINIYAIQPLFNFLASTGLGFGLVILLLTIVLKLVLMPVQWKMYVSSAKMRILKPEIDELNAKFPNKEDAMKKQMEMMTLYKESGASPLSGCVPMLIQMPILLAVFRFFPAAFELRQQSFLWAEDLSSYDSIYDFGFYIWPYGDHISLFTLLMSVTTLAYTWMNSGNMQQPSQPGMPNMKVLMYIFPVMMIFFFNNYASGLSYYYFISTLMSILIMVAIKKFFVDEDKLKAKMAAKKAANASNGGVKQKSKFQERLEQMQKAQLEKAKQRKK